MSSISDATNPFASSSGFNSVAPSPAMIRDLTIADHVPVTLSHASANFYAWKTYFRLLFREYHLTDHIDGTADLLSMSRDADWMAIDATITRWLFLTVSKDIFHTVVRDGDDAYTGWTKIIELFTDNKMQQIVFLQQEFFGCPQNDLSLDAAAAPPISPDPSPPSPADSGESLPRHILLISRFHGVEASICSPATNPGRSRSHLYRAQRFHLRRPWRRVEATGGRDAPRRPAGPRGEGVAAARAAADVLEAAASESRRRGGLQPRPAVLLLVPHLQAAALVSDWSYCTGDLAWEKEGLSEGLCNSPAACDHVAGGALGRPPAWASPPIRPIAGKDASCHDLSQAPMPSAAVCRLHRGGCAVVRH